MKVMVLTKKQRKEMDEIVEFFMQCVEPISDRSERGMVSAKILSHLACFTDKLLGIPEDKIKWRNIK
jgi:hypothetical protein